MCKSERLYAKFPTLITDSDTVDIENMFIAQQEPKEDWQQPDVEETKEAVYINTWIVIDMSLVDSYHPTFMGESDELKYTLVQMSNGNVHILDTTADVFENKLIGMLGYSYDNEEDNRED